MSWGGPHCRYSYGSGGAGPLTGGVAFPPPPSPRYLGAASALPPLATSPSAAPSRSVSCCSPWGQVSDALGTGSPCSAASPAAASTAAADEEQLQSMVSALRVALGKKESALVSVAGQLADVQGRLAGCEAERRQLEAQLCELQQAVPDRLPSAAGLTPEGRLLAQARQELGLEVARAAELAAERDALQQGVALLQQQLTAAAQAEAMERERLCTEASQSRLLARARARQVEQLQAELRHAAGLCTTVGAAAAQEAQAALAEAASGKAAAAEAQARAAAAEAQAAQLQQELDSMGAARAEADSRASQAETELAEARQHADWQALRIAELEQTSSVGQLMRRYEGEVQRLREQHEVERQKLQQQLEQAKKQYVPQRASATHAEQFPCPAGTPPGVDSAAWAALFDEPSGSSQQASATEMQDACVQTEEQQQQQRAVEAWADPALFEAARLEIERLQQLNAGLLESQKQAQHALQDALEQQRAAAMAAERHEAERHAERHADSTAQQLALESARRAEAGLREQLVLTERQLAHQNGEVQALREANEKLELAATAFKEELDAAGELVPVQEVERLQVQVQQAVAHTASLEAQVQQLKEQGAAAAMQHATAVQQQEQRGAAAAAAQVAAAVQAASVLHDQQVAALQGQLAEAHQQLQAARSSLSELLQEQLLPREGMCDAAVQASAQLEPAAAVKENMAVQTEAGWGGDFQATAAAALPALLPEPRSLVLSRAASACESPGQPCIGGSDGASGVQPVAQTAKQLQLELARVRIASPLRPLPCSSSQLRAGGRLPQAPSRLGSAFGEHGCFGSNGMGGNGMGSIVLAGAFPGSSLGGGGGSSSRLVEEDEEDEDDEGFFVTPPATTPTAQTPKVSSPFGGDSDTAGAEWGSASRLNQQQQQQQQPWQPPEQHWQRQQQQEQQQGPQPGQQQQQGQQRAIPVPALDLRRVRPYSSLSCESCSPGGPGAAGASARSSPMLPAAEASTSVSSLSSLGPSASQLAGWTPSLPPAMGLAGADSSSLLGHGGGLLGGEGQRHVSFDAADLDSSEGSQLGASWQADRLDASLARLAALTSGLLSGGPGARRR